MIGMKIHVNVFTTAIREHKIFICILSRHSLLRVVSLGLFTHGFVGMRPLQRITGMAL